MADEKPPRGCERVYLQDRWLCPTVWISTAAPEATIGKPMRLDVWLHGRGEKVSEVAFLHQRMNSVGDVAPENTIVLHPYGRYCNAFKFAGEIDVLEAIEHVKRTFVIDEDRISIRGFSMGGAGCWQMAVHYPGMWMAATRVRASAKLDSS